MVVAYSAIFELKPTNETDTATKMFVGHNHGDNILLSLSSANFDLKFKNGKVESGLYRFLTREEAKELAQAILSSLG